MKTKLRIPKRILSLVLAFVMVLGMMPVITMTASAASYSTSATLSSSGHRYNLTLTRLDRYDYNGDVYYYYGNVEEIACNSITETDTTVEFDISVYFAYVNGGIVEGRAKITVNKAACDEQISQTVTVECYDFATFNVTIQVSRSVYDHQGSATCTTAANCTVCGESYINANNHDTSGPWLRIGDTHYKLCYYGCGEKLNTASCTYSTATCSAASTCTTCGYEKSGIDANAHSWGAWISNGDGTHTRTCSLNNSHTEDGNCSGGTVSCMEKAVCTTCKAAYGELKEHSTSSENDRPATCTTPAYCGVCQKEYGEALGHSTGKTGDIPVTCTEAAYCSVCEENYGEPLGHSTDKAGDRLATHTTRAYCSVCQQEYGEADPDAHVYSNGFCDCGAYEPAADTDGDGVYEIGNGGNSIGLRHM